MFAKLIAPGTGGVVAPLAATGWCILWGDMPVAGGCRGGIFPKGGPCIIGAERMGI